MRALTKAQQTVQQRVARSGAHLHCRRAMSRVLGILKNCFSPAVKLKPSASSQHRVTYWSLDFSPSSSLRASPSDPAQAPCGAMRFVSLMRSPRLS